MAFDSLTYIGFFVVVVALYRTVRQWHHKKNLLLLASYLFYASWNPWFLPLLIGTSVFDWGMSLQMAKRTGARRKPWLWATLIVNLGVLATFKYLYFFTDSAASLARLVGVDWHPPVFDVILPIGISFYTFHSLSYCIDVYRGHFAPVRNLRDYLLYVSFFPQLVAGPIVRWSEMGQQIETPRTMSWGNTSVGTGLLVMGLFAKVVLADAIFAPVADAAFSNTPPSHFYTAWLGALAFGGQIFCDFAGYSSCALGSALVFGFRLPINFLNPYAAVGFSDFWRRWHISLSSWLRDYLYIGMGGNRNGRFATYRNLLLTMLIGGLWHGAAWTFVVWGGLHGLYLVAERFITQRTPNWTTQLPMRRWLLRLLTLALVTYAWVWFRAPNASYAWQMSKSMWGFAGLNNATALNAQQVMALVAAALLVAYQWLMKNQTEAGLLQKLPLPITALLLGTLLALVIASPGDSYAFIYFQF